MYRSGITPWERYATAAAASITARLDREEAVGIDYLPAAIEAAAAKSRGTAGLSYLAGDVTRLPSVGLGTFGFFC